MIEKKTLRTEEIERCLSDMIDSIEIVEKNIPNNFKDSIDFGLKKDGIYKKIEFAIESVVDICNIINSDFRLGVPDVEDDIFDNLEKEKIFSKKTISIIRDMKGFRNVLVHKYGKIEDKKAFESIREGLEDFEFVIKEIEDFLKNHKKKS